MGHVMKKAFALAVLTFSLSAILFAQPKIEIVGGGKFDFGNIYRGKKVEHKVVVKNSGTKHNRANRSCEGSEGRRVFQSTRRALFPEGVRGGWIGSIAVASDGACFRRGASHELAVV